MDAEEDPSTGIVTALEPRSGSGLGIDRLCGLGGSSLVQDVKSGREESDGLDLVHTPPLS